MGLTYTTAFIAGMLSFISPCVLPLAPGYVAMEIRWDIDTSGRFRLLRGRCKFEY